jgi:hypothetical protein
MSVTAFREIIDGRGASQRFAETVKCKRSFLVTVDDPTTQVTEIADSIGIAWLDPHPEFPAVYVTDIAAQNDGDPLHYKVEFTYDLIKPEDRAKLPWQRKDKFSYDGALTSAPCFLHYNDGNGSPKLIVNSAGDPLEGLQRDEAEWVVNIEGNRQYFIKSVARQYLNAVNSDAWSECEPGTVKCQRISGKLEIEQVEGQEITYWSVSITLAYRETGWATKTWDVGFNQIVSGQRRKILDSTEQPVSQPVALSGGAAKAAGSPPDMLTFHVYKRLPFAGIFPVLP